MPEVLEQKQEAEVKAVPQADETRPQATEETKPAEKHDELPKGVQRTINRLTRQRGEAMSAVMDLQREVEELKQLVKTGARPVAPIEDKGPKLEDYENYSDFVDARINWVAERKVQERLEAEEQEAERAEQDEAAREIFKRYNDRVEEARERYPDWEEVKQEAEGLQMTEAVQMTIMEHENGPDVVYHLAKNPELCESLLTMTPMRAAAEIGKIAYELSKGKPAKITSKAAAPVSPVVAGSATSTTPLGKMNFQDFVAARNAQRKALGKKVY